MPIDAKLSQWADKEFGRKNYPSAAEKLQMGLAKCQDDLEARQKLRLVARRHLIENPPSKIAKLTKGGKVAKMKATMRLKKDPSDMMQAAEEVLFEEPNDISTLQFLAQASESLELFSVVQWILEDAIKLEPENIDLWISLGILHQEKTKNFEEAKKCYLKVLKMDSKQTAILKRLRAIEATEAMVGEADGSDITSALKDQTATLEDEILRTVIRNAEDARKHVAIIKKDLDKDPKNIKIMEKIADRYRQGELFKECIEWLEKALTLEPTNGTIKIRIGEVKLQKATAQKDKLAEMYKKDPKNAKIVENFKKSKLIELKMGLDLYKDMVEAHPTDLRMKYKYGDYLLKAKKYKDAVGQFQKSLKDPKIADESNEALARCFMHLGKHKMSFKYLDDCLAKASEGGDWWKELTYLKAKCFEATGDKDNAVNLYEKIYEIDIDFKDVSDLI